MTELSLSPSGYSNRRSPAALLVSVALNLSAVALVIAVPMTVLAPPKTPPITTTSIPLRDPPPPNPDPTPETKQKPMQQTPDPAPQLQPIAIDTPFDPVAKGPEIAINYPPLDPGIGKPVERTDPPPPVIVPARRDPRYAGAFQPAYPPSLIRDGLEGDVTVRVTIDPRGRVTAVELVKASNPVFFEETKRQALRNWRFVAATRDGVAIESTQTLTVHFRLEE